MNSYQNAHSTKLSACLLEPCSCTTQVLTATIFYKMFRFSKDNAIKVTEECGSLKNYHDQLQSCKLRNRRLLFPFNVALSLLNLPNSRSVLPTKSLIFHLRMHVVSQKKNDCNHVHEIKYMSI